VALEIEKVIVKYPTMETAIEQHAKGMEQIGSGLYGRVYTSNGTPYVVKFFKGHDSGYRSWIETIAELANTGPLAKYTPKISRVLCYRMPDADYQGEVPGETIHDTWVVYMERLAGYNEQGTIRGAKNDMRIRKFGDLFRNIMYRARYCEDEPFDYSKLSPIHRDLIALILIAREKYGSGCDCHNGNIMLRGSQIVITDPLA